jgi:N-methylhydantoinase A
VGAADRVVEELTRRAQRDMFAEGFEFKECVLEWGIVRVRGDDEFELPWSPLQCLPKELADGDHVSVFLRVVKPINHASFAAVNDAATVPAVSGGKRRVQTAATTIVDLPVYRIEAQPSGASGEGPCILEEAYFTGRIGAGWRFAVNANRDTILTKSKSEKR